MTDDADPRPCSRSRGLTKRFTGTLALDAVDFDVRAGEVHALLGENGAGKSTLIKVLAGVHRADDGDDPPARPRASIRRREKLPITFIHQDLGLVDTMTVAENVAVLAGYPRRRGLISWRASARRRGNGARAHGRRRRSRRARRRPAGRREVDRRDRPRDGGEMRSSRARRADRRPAGSRRRAAARRAAAAARRAASASST